MFKNLLRRLSQFVQGKNTSMRRHHLEMIEPEAFLREQKIALTKISNDEINYPELRIDDLLHIHPEVKIAVDIGSGAGWASATLAKKMTSVIGIEPSSAGIDLAKAIFPQEQYPTITWKQGMAEEVLQTLELDGPTLFITGCVLSHLRDKEVLAICTALNTIAPTGSVLAFSEAWNEDEWHQIMWHVRSKDWWRKALTNWELDFHGQAQPDKKAHMGFWGVKK